MYLLPDRDAADEATEAISYHFAANEGPLLVRDAIPQEDGPDGALWLVMVEDPKNRVNVGALDAFIADWDGWRREA
ncbi:hypothetical protein ABZY19_38050 [Streptomyces sp. NPDC006475]|uniref:hypothetical protein n=1 Tax=Streptomyces sp. NPDC006475 TaxID=3155719 RepID=UPI00339EEB0D